VDCRDCPIALRDEHNPVGSNQETVLMQRQASIRAWLHRAAGSTAMIAVLGSPGGAQDRTAPARPLDGPQLLRTSTGTVRVTAIRGFKRPFSLAFLPGGAILVSETGRNTLRIIRDGILDPTPVTGLPPGVTTLRQGYGGVDLVLHPRFAANHLLYVACWVPRPGTTDMKTLVLLRARFDGGTRLTDVHQIFESSSWTDGPSVARLAFGVDGTLYLSVGATGFSDSVGPAAWAQDPAEYGGKILRLNDDGTAARDNPFVNRPGYKPEIFALGIRNVGGLTIHPDTGELWETEHGPQGGDEVNIIRAGRNYGWPLVTYGRAYAATDPDGRKSGLPPATVQPPSAAPGMEEPFTFYKPSIATAGLTFYTGDKFPRWKGNLLVGGLAGMQLSRIVLNRQGLEVQREALLLELRQRIRDVKQGPDDYIYLTTDMDDGAVLRLEPAEP
jgi:aldose sugar dehydrogenase